MANEVKRDVLPITMLSYLMLQPVRSVIDRVARLPRNALRDRRNCWNQMYEYIQNHLIKCVRWLMRLNDPFSIHCIHEDMYEALQCLRLITRHWSEDIRLARASG